MCLKTYEFHQNTFFYIYFVWLSLLPAYFELMGVPLIVWPVCDDVVTCVRAHRRSNPFLTWPEVSRGYEAPVNFIFLAL